MGDFRDSDDDLVSLAVLKNLHKHRKQLAIKWARRRKSRVQSLARPTEDHRAKWVRYVTGDEVVYGIELTEDHTLVSKELWESIRFDLHKPWKKVSVQSDRSIWVDNVQLDFKSDCDLVLMSSFGSIHLRRCVFRVGGNIAFLMPNGHIYFHDSVVISQFPYTKYATMFKTKLNNTAQSSSPHELPILKFIAEGKGHDLTGFFNRQDSTTPVMSVIDPTPWHARDSKNLSHFLGK